MIDTEEPRSIASGTSAERKEFDIFPSLDLRFDAGPGQIEATHVLILKIKQFLRHRFLVSTLGIAVLAELVLIGILFFVPGMKFDDKIGITAFTGIPLLVIAIFQLARNIRLQRADFIKEYVSRLFTDSDINRAYHDLVNNYKNSDFIEIEAIMKKAVKKNKNLAEPVFEPFEEFNAGRAVGSRLYHPEYFKGSEEERRLDGLLGYLDVIGYFYHRGLLKIEDITAAMGYFLAVINAKQVIKRYLGYTLSEWDRLADEELVNLSNALPPFHYLRRLLKDFAEYNQKSAAERRQALGNGVKTTGF